MKDDPSPSRVLVAGCGYVGGPLARSLVESGCEVVGLRRTPGAVPSRVKAFAADLSQPDSLRDLPGPFDAVFFTAAANSRLDEAYRALFVEGMRNLIAALRLQEQPLRRIVMTSSTGVYGQSRGEWVDETTPAEPPNIHNRFILEGEKLLLDSGLPAAVVRFAGMYGPGRIRLIKAVLEVKAGYPPGPPLYLNQIHRDDCVGVLRHIMDLKNPPSLTIAADDEPASRKEVLSWIARRLAAPPPRTTAGHTATGGKRRGNKRCSNKQLRESGYKFKYPTYREGYQALIDDLQ